eukprot:TRINITY_DN5131_c0_g2_i3.p1 TRINITY_DN5131_c0_g2~~TRINITY_DN5131_c0_g2_i3.p1  ORF type:complete len:1763 (+),score=273.22 TRINITY_DN5131_c0_g2_i3:86-5374(+)
MSHPSVVRVSFVRGGSVESLRNMRVWECTETNAAEECVDVLLHARRLEFVRITKAQLSVIPKELASLSRLKIANLSHNKITSISVELLKLPCLQELHLQDNLIEEFPEFFSSCPSLYHLDLSQNKISKLPNSIDNLINLEHLCLSKNELKDIPATLMHLSKLIVVNVSENKLEDVRVDFSNMRIRELYLSQNKLDGLPAGLSALRSLEVLDISENKVTSLSHITSCTNLIVLNAATNQITSVPHEFGDLKQLRQLTLRGNPLHPDDIHLWQCYNFMSHTLDLTNQNLDMVPSSITRITSLHALRLDHNNLTALPDEIGDLLSLKFITLSHNMLSKLPSTMSRLSNLVGVHVEKNQLTAEEDLIWRLYDFQQRRLSIAAYGISNFPLEASKLPALRELDLSENKMTELQYDMNNLSALQVIHLSHNKLESIHSSFTNLKQLKCFRLAHNLISCIPKDISALQSITLLDLSNNMLQNVPDELIDLSQLKKMSLANNEITALPVRMGFLRRLEHLNISNNQIRAFPESFSRLTNLTSLQLVNNDLADDDAIVWEALDVNTKRVDLSSRGLTYLPSSLSRLVPFTLLDIRENKISSLPDFLGGLSALADIEFSRNPLVFPPKVVQSRGGGHIIRFLQARMQGTSTWDMTRLFIVGPAQSGKSTLIRALQAHDARAPRSQSHRLLTSRTRSRSDDSAVHGVEIVEPRIAIGVGDAGRIIDVEAWEFADDDRFAAFRPLLISGDAPAVVVLRADLNTSISSVMIETRRWVSFLASHGAASVRCPFSIVFVMASLGNKPEAANDTEQTETGSEKELEGDRARDEDGRSSVGRNEIVDAAKEACKDFAHAVRLVGVTVVGGEMDPRSIIGAVRQLLAATHAINTSVPKYYPPLCVALCGDSCTALSLNLDKDREQQHDKNRSGGRDRNREQQSTNGTPVVSVQHADSLARSLSPYASIDAALLLFDAAGLVLWRPCVPARTAVVCDPQFLLRILRSIATVLYTADNAHLGTRTREPSPSLSTTSDSCKGLNETYVPGILPRKSFHTAALPLDLQGAQDFALLYLQHNRLAICTETDILFPSAMCPASPPLEIWDPTALPISLSSAPPHGDVVSIHGFTTLMLSPPTAEPTNPSLFGPLACALHAMFTQDSGFHVEQSFLSGSHYCVHVADTSHASGIHVSGIHASGIHSTTKRVRILLEANALDGSIIVQIASLTHRGDAWQTALRIVAVAEALAPSHACGALAIALGCPLCWLETRDRFAQGSTPLRPHSAHDLIACSVASHAAPWDQWQHGASFTTDVLASHPPQIEIPLCQDPDRRLPIEDDTCMGDHTSGPNRQMPGREQPLLVDLVWTEGPRILNEWTLWPLCDSPLGLHRVEDLAFPITETGRLMTSYGWLLRSYFAGRFAYPVTTAMSLTTAGSTASFTSRSASKSTAPSKPTTKSTSTISTQGSTQGSLQDSPVIAPHLMWRLRPWDLWHLRQSSLHSTRNKDLVGSVESFWREIDPASRTLSALSLVHITSMHSRWLCGKCAQCFLPLCPPTRPSQPIRSADLEGFLWRRDPRTQLQQQSQAQTPLSPRGRSQSQESAPMSPRGRSQSQESAPLSPRGSAPANVGHAHQTLHATRVFALIDRHALELRVFPDELRVCPILTIHLGTSPKVELLESSMRADKPHAALTPRARHTANGFRVTASDGTAHEFQSDTAEEANRWMETVRRLATDEPTPRPMTLPASPRMDTALRGSTPNRRSRHTPTLSPPVEVVGESESANDAL